jgi:ATP-dependent DNA helicase
VKQVNNMKLQNTVMQLRKVCSHPFLFDWPVDPVSLDPVINEDLVNASGKMMLLERLLDELFSRGHKVLLFSQFTMMLDIIEVCQPLFLNTLRLTMLQDWALEFKGWKICRIDGSTSALERREQVDMFQEAPPNDPDAPQLFLLSTRAGGMGLNLTAADTVIFYDQDWVCRLPSFVSTQINVLPESSNGSPGSGSSSPHWTNQTRAGFPPRYCPHN